MKRRSRRTEIGHWIENILLWGLIRSLLLLPYATRVRLSGWAMSRIASPLAGYDDRVRANLQQVMPDLDVQDVRRLVRAVPQNVGRTLIEIYSGRAFVDRIAGLPMSGPGLAALDAAHAAGRPVILVTGHFGNFDASRAAMIARGYHVGGLYRPMNNRWFNVHYVRALASIGGSIFPRGRKGLGAMVRFLRGGGMLIMLIDVHSSDGERLRFFGQEALTALSAAELALKYDALVVPTYGIRAPNGLDFDIRVENPIPAGTPEEMTQALNDSLEAMVRDHMDQWFWIHRRWKPGRRRANDAP